MYGACEEVKVEDSKRLVVHNMLRKHKVWNGTPLDAKKHLESQVVVNLESEEDLSSAENIVKFINKYSLIGKHIHEIQEIGETLTCTIYKVGTSEDDIAIKVPKKIENGENYPFLDLIYETQLVQFL